MGRENCFNGRFVRLAVIPIFCMVLCVLPVEGVVADELKEDTQMDEIFNITSDPELDFTEAVVNNPSWTEYYNSLAERLDNDEVLLSDNQEEITVIREDLDGVAETISNAAQEVKNEVASSNGLLKELIEQMSGVPSGIDEANKTLKEIKKTIESLKKMETKADEEDPMVQIIDGVEVIIENQNQLKEDNVKLILSTWAIGGLIIGLAIMRDTFR